MAEEYQPKIEAAKGNADDVTPFEGQREAVLEAFAKKLDGVPSESSAADKKAAEEEAKRGSKR